jgi:hypothetical protein
MRVLQAAGLTAAALLLTSVASAQGLGDAAAAARQKRKTDPAKPAKVYTDGDIGQSMTPASSTVDLPATAAPATPATAGDQPASEGAAPPEGQPAPEGQAPKEGVSPAEPKAAEDAASAEAEAHARAAEAWRKRLEQARQEEADYKGYIDKLQFQMNGTTGLYSPGRAANAASLEEYKKKLADTQAKIAALQEEGRRNNYR